MTNLKRSEFQAHPFHLVSPSPWPFYTSIFLLTLTSAAVLTMHSFSNPGYFLLLTLIALVLCMSLWWTDVISEGKIKTLKPLQSGLIPWKNNNNIAQGWPIRIYNAIFSLTCCVFMVSVGLYTNIPLYSKVFSVLSVINIIVLYFLNSPNLKPFSSEDWDLIVFYLFIATMLYILTVFFTFRLIIFTFIGCNPVGFLLNYKIFVENSKERKKKVQQFLENWKLDFLRFYLKEIVCIIIFLILFVICIYTAQPWYMYICLLLILVIIDIAFDNNTGFFGWIILGLRVKVRHIDELKILFNGPIPYRIPYLQVVLVLILFLFDYYFILNVGILEWNITWGFLLILLIIVVIMVSSSSSGLYISYFLYIIFTLPGFRNILSEKIRKDILRDKNIFTCMTEHLNNKFKSQFGRSSENNIKGTKAVGYCLGLFIQMLLRLLGNIFFLIVSLVVTGFFIFLLLVYIKDSNYSNPEVSILNILISFLNKGENIDNINNIEGIKDIFTIVISASKRYYFELLGTNSLNTEVPLSKTQEFKALVGTKELVNQTLKIPINIGYAALSPIFWVVHLFTPVSNVDAMMENTFGYVQGVSDSIVDNLYIQNQYASKIRNVTKPIEDFCHTLHSVIAVISPDSLKDLTGNKGFILLRLTWIGFKFLLDRSG